jgi:hypothetical protein
MQEIPPAKFRWPHGLSRRELHASLIPLSFSLCGSVLDSTSFSLSVKYVPFVITTPATSITPLLLVLVALLLPCTPLFMTPDRHIIPAPQNDHATPKTGRLCTVAVCASTLKLRRSKFSLP